MIRTTFIAALTALVTAATAVGGTADAAKRKPSEATTFVNLTADYGQIGPLTEITVSGSRIVVIADDLSITQTFMEPPVSQSRTFLDFTVCGTRQTVHVRMSRLDAYQAVTAEPGACG